jgi:hypothetical protein
MAPRERNYAFEALAEVTGTDWTVGRGELNAALKSIREQTEVEDSYLLGDLIHERAKMYREVMPEVMLTPPALAKHWRRVLEESEHRNRSRATNRAATTRCSTCDGDRFVLVRLRPQKATAWMIDHNIKPSTTEMHEEYAPCPDCNPVEIKQFRYDGTVFRSMDPAAVRDTLRQ